MREVIRDPDSGEVLAATCIDRPLPPETRAAMVGLARAAQRCFAEEDAASGGELSARQEAARVRSHARLVRLGLAEESEAQGG